MNGQRPVEGQTVEVKLVDGEWQQAVYREAKFVDLYGLPLEAEKIAEWRAIAGTSAGEADLNGATRIERSTDPAARTTLN